MTFLPVSWRPFAKFIVPALLVVAAAVVKGVIEGKWGRQELEVGFVGLAGAVVAFLGTDNSVNAGVRHFVGAISVALLTVVGVGIHWALTGEWNATETTAAVTGLLVALAALAVPNDRSFTASSYREVPAPRPVA